MMLMGKNWSTLGKTCPRATLHHISHMDWPGIEPGHIRWEAGI